MRPIHPSQLQSELFFDTEDMVSMVRPRRHRPHLLLDLRLRGVLIVDGATGSRIAHVEFPEEAEEFEIHDWVVAQEGDRSYLFPADPQGFLLEVDLADRSSRTIRHADDFGDTYLCWFLPTLLFLDHDQVGWIVDGERLVRASQEQLRVRLPTHLRDLIREGASIHKIGADGEIYYTGAERHGARKMGCLDARGGGALAVAEYDTPLDMTRVGEDLLVCFKQQIVACRHDARETVLEAPEDCWFTGINTIHDFDRRGLSVLGLQDDRAVLRSYRL